MLLIISGKEDPSTDYFILRLRERSIPYFRFNTEDYCNGYGVEIAINNSKASFVIHLNNSKTIYSSDISGVYFHHPKVPKHESYIDPTNLEFIQREKVEVLRSLWRMIPSNLWLNHPRNILNSSNKIDQLITASKFGLNIPNTLITTSKSNIVDFIAHEYSVIAKAIKHGFVENENRVIVAPTQKITEEYLENIDAYSRVPMIIQNEIDKIVDVRVVIVGNTFFPAAIYSQEQTETMVDWRVGDIHDIKVNHEKHELPQDVMDKLLILLNHYELRYASIDMVLNKRAEYVFLELNPDGQWAWIEQLLNYPIRDTMIQYYLSGENYCDNV